MAASYPARIVSQNSSPEISIDADISAQGQLPLSATSSSAIITSYSRRLSGEEITLVLQELIITSPKVIEINLTQQKLTTWEYGTWKGESVITTGKPSTPTRTGVFRVLDKLDFAYGGDGSQSWKMPYWMGIYFSGSTENGLHELPYINGYRESSRSLGRPLSHGCVRLPLGIAESVYHWAELGTPVVIHN